MEGEDPKKKSGFKGIQENRKFACSINSVVYQKVAQTPHDNDLQPLQVDEDVEKPILERAASKSAMRKLTKSELEDPLKRAI